MIMSLEQGGKRHLSHLSDNISTLQLCSLLCLVIIVDIYGGQFCDICYLSFVRHVDAVSHKVDSDGI